MNTTKYFPTTEAVDRAATVLSEILEPTPFMKNNNPSFYYRHYHSEHFWWDNDLAKEFRTRIEGCIEIPHWRTRLNVKFENVKNYTYIANHSTPSPNGIGYLNRFNVEQENGHIQVIAASLKQDFKFGIFNLNTEFTYQHISNQAVLPLPAFNAYANLFKGTRAEAICP